MYFNILGCGLACNYLSGLTVIPLYFRKYRTFAFNVYSAGGNTSTFLFPPLISVLMNFYSWRGTLLILSGFLLQNFVFALLFRSKERKRAVEKSHQKMISEFEDELQNCQPSDKQEHVSQESRPKQLVSNGCSKSSMSWLSLGSLQRLKGSDCDCENGHVFGSQCKINGINRSKSPECMTNGSTRTLPGTGQRSPISFPKLSLSAKGLEVHSSWSVLAIDDDGEIHNFSRRESASNQIADQTCFSKISKYYYLDIFKNKGFLSILGVCVFRACGKGTVLLYLTNLLRSNDYHLNFIAKVFVVIGLSQLISTPILGFIANRLKTCNVHFWIISLLLSGALTLISTMVLHNWVLLCVVLSLYGIADSNFDSMWGAVISDVLDLKRIGNGAGTAACFYGVTVTLVSQFTGMYIKAKRKESFGVASKKYLAANHNITLNILKPLPVTDALSMMKMSKNVLVIIKQN